MEVVPFLEANEGFRFLGYHLDLMGDYGDQQDRLRVVIDDFGAKLARARISKGLVMYMVEAVLIPRVLYPMTVIPFTPDHIRHLESRALRWIYPKIGLTRTFARDLVGADLDWGGLGWDRWTGRVAVARSALAVKMAGHPSPEIRGVWTSMRQRHLMEHPHRRLGPLGCAGGAGWPHDHETIPKM